MSKKDTKQLIIKRKKDTVRTLYSHRSKKVQDNLCSQIEICEHLLCPITENQILEWRDLTLNQILNNCRKNKGLSPQDSGTIFKRNQTIAHNYI